MLAKTPCLMRLRITSIGLVCSESARSFTTICGGIETGPVGFSFTAIARRSCGRCTGAVGRPAVAGRETPCCPPGRVAVGDALPGLLIGRETPPGAGVRATDVPPVEVGRCGNVVLAGR